MSRYIANLIAVNLIALSGAACSQVDSEPTPDEELLEQAQSLQTGESNPEDVPYEITCQDYGGCTYCSDLVWDNWERCWRECYGVSCDSGDEANGCTGCVLAC